MAGSERSGGCLRFGCIGCAALIVVPILIVVVMVLIGLLTAPGDPVVEQVGQRQPLDVRSIADDRDPDAEALPDRLGPGGQPGQVELDLSMGTFRVVSGAPGEAIRVDGEYDSSVYELIETYTVDDENRWSYKLSIQQRVGWLALLFRGDSPINEFQITLPREVPMELVAGVGAGESRFELGGLDLRRANISSRMGTVDVRFETPTVYPLGFFRLKSSMGESAIFGLGNASPARVEVRQSMGEMRVGLDGRWRSDSEIDLGLGMGSMQIGSPAGVRLVLEDVSQSMGEVNLDALRSLPDAGPDAPTLKLSVTQSMGEVSAD